MDLLTFDNLFAFLTLTGLEVVLGIDNVIFIAILAGRLPPHQRDLARKLGLTVAVISRIALLLGISWVMKLTNPVLPGYTLTGKDLVLIIGGLFLVGKATHEMRHKLTAHEEHGADGGKPKYAGLTWMLLQVLFIDVIFSLDSVITAVGMSENLTIMIGAVLTSIVVMLVFSKLVVDFVDRHPEIKLLALSFLLMIGTLLIAEGFHYHIPKGYVYFAMAYALTIDLLQMRLVRPLPEGHAPQDGEGDSAAAPPAPPPVPQIDVDGQKSDDPLVNAASK